MPLSPLAVRRPVATGCLMAAAALIGLISLTRLPVNLLPPLDVPSLTVWTTWSNAAPALVAHEITEPIEAALRSLPGVRQIRSVSREGESLVTVDLAWGTRLQAVLLTARERLDALRFQLPEDSDRPTILDTDPARAPVMGLVLRPARASAQPGVSPAGADLHYLADQTIRRRLEQLSGVARARVIGGVEPEVHVTIDPGRLAVFGLSLDGVGRTLASANLDLPGGLIRRGNYRYALRVAGAFRHLDDLRETVLMHHPEGGIVRVRDVAQVTMGEAERLGAVLADGEPAIGILVQKTADASILDASAEVRQAVAQIDASLPDVSLSIAFDQAAFLRRAIRSALLALALGGALAFCILLVWFRNLRYALIIAITMPVAVIASFALLDGLGVGLNLLSIGGLALGVGMVVDNAIIAMENIFRHRQAGVDIHDAAGRGAAEVALPMAASTLTTIAVFLPMAFTGGVSGQLFRDQSLAVTVSLLLSWLVALTLLPALAGRLASQPASGNDAMSTRFHNVLARYQRAVDAVLDHPWRFAGALLLGLALTMPLAWRLPRALFPEVDAGEIWVELALPVGTSLETTTDAARAISQAAQRMPEAGHTLATVGAARESFTPRADLASTALERARIQVVLAADAAPHDARTAMTELRRLLPPGLRDYVELKPPATTLSAVLSGGEPDLAIRIFHETAAQESRLLPDAGIPRGRSDDTRDIGIVALALQDALAASEAALADIRLRGVERRPGYRILIDRHRAAQLGVSPERVAMTVRAYLQGRIATEFARTDEKIPIVLRGGPSVRRNMEALLDAPVQTSYGQTPLRAVVQVEQTDVTGEILRIDQKRMAVMEAEVLDEDLIGAANRIQRRIEEGALLPQAPDGVRVEVAGAQQVIQDSFRRLAFALLLSVMIVFLVLAAQFESLRLPWIIIAIIPLALAGVVATLTLMGEGVNITTWIGTIVLVGIVVNDAILKVDFIARAERSGLSRRQAIHAAGRQRLRPILMTTVTTVFGVAPLAFGIGAGGEFGAPLARTIVGGLLIGSALTLFVTPLLYNLLAAKTEQA